MNRPRPTIALYPGSFDPITYGHEDIARRALIVADRLIIAVAHASTHVKSSLFDVVERTELIREVLAGEERVEVMAFQGLLVDFARKQGAHIVVRGLRAVSDFEYELQMAQMNQELWPELETIFLVPEARYSFISSSLVREVATLGGDVASFVSPPVLERLAAKLGRK
ncbi:MAG TPA: pantetheine-phosphate adenylyltransferase [Longimicrobiales bacterium]|jgi:pantetheine-phosphate adenylyltransferase|nr:pantetheine-phosphate adenylyltransferase [Longimicrobiales bacterium]